MYDAILLEVICECVFDCFACIFFAAVGVEEFEFISGLPFDHCEPKFKNFEDRI